MKLTVKGIKEKEGWEKNGIVLPGYDVEAVSARAKEAPVWVHFGIGNIFRFLSEELQTDFWKRVCWIGESPVWRLLIMM